MKSIQGGALQAIRSLGSPKPDLALPPTSLKPGWEQARAKFQQEAETRRDLSAHGPAKARDRAMARAATPDDLVQRLVMLKNGTQEAVDASTVAHSATGAATLQLNNSVVEAF